MRLRYQRLQGAQIDAALDDLARLRITVFRDWPYLYDGDGAYERDYLSAYRNSADALLVTAEAGGRIVGLSTGTPMEDHADSFANAFEGSGYDLGDIFYCAESVLLPEWRGQGAGHAFFEAREAHARALGRRFAVFCAVLRPPEHPLRPANYRALDGFWRGRGYAPLERVVARHDWKDVDQPHETTHQLQFWGKEL